MPETKEKKEKKEEIVEVNTGVATPVESNLEFRIDPSDINIPYYAIKSALSQYDAGELGDLVVDKTHVVAKGGEPVEVSIIKMIKGWEEDVKFGNPKERVYSMEARDELAARSPNELKEFAEITFAIEKPEDGDDGAYPFPIGDKFYTIGILTVKNYALVNTYKRVCTLASFNPSMALGDKKWKLTVNHVQGKNNDWWQPELAVTQEDSPQAIIDFVASFNS
jgi:hypothetical protein